MPVMTELEPAAPLLRALKQEELFPIREVSRLTGVNPVTLRAWERRYGLIQPTRTESGHRLYAMSDIETVRTIMGWIERGVAVSKVGKILAKTSAQAQPIHTPSGIAAQSIAQAEWDDWQTQLRVAVSAFDEPALERLYGQVFSSYPLTVVFQNILLPLWQRLQQGGEFGQASEWLFLDTFLRARVLQRLHLVRGLPSQRIVLAALPDQCRELELLVAGLLLGDGDRSVSVLAVGQPFDELTLVCEKVRPEALVLYSNRSPLSDLPRRLNRLALSVDCAVMLAGDVSELLQERLEGSSIGCLGNDGRLMRRRLQQLLAGRLDT
ncbi:MerR family transcriptional regulator [Pseudomonas gingeri]|uniref:MerR family transcriptional regulator n=1 Tax=Pseudomonas gingeri TaxID=117681 RepID=A0A7Y7XFU5_9PSED|nr:MerR family transcriptional regulator [Pseudomonas gingeri]NWA23429.1 MerR family transcriptional regulator [Pseudomonas gingeri]NWB98845.1 MerR family transcriptional regulator [Pseudomonas gingeri]NWD68471.1 MerR family transcriptional regulator [Pseudomonas gingeri]